MDEKEAKRTAFNQTGEAVRISFGRSAVAVVEHDSDGIRDFGSGTCIFYRDHYLIMTAGHVLEGVPKENLNLVYTPGPSNDRVPIEGILYKQDTASHLDLGIVVISPEVAKNMGKDFLGINRLELNPANLSTDLVALQGYPGGWFVHQDRKYGQFTSLTYSSICHPSENWHTPINLDVDLEFEYPEEVIDAQTNQLVKMPDVRGMSGGGMWVLNANSPGLWTPESAKLVGIITRWSETKGYVRGNRVSHWLKFADEAL